jgi:Zn-dependent protease
VEYIPIVPMLLFSVVVHEVAHGWVAMRLGDPTARDLGRLTLNPIPHLDLMGSVIIPLLSIVTSGRVFIAWAKPVPVNPANFSRPRRDDILVTVAGPLSNILLAAGCTLAFIFLSTFAGAVEEGTFADSFLAFFLQMFYGGIMLNTRLALLKMIPVPPLDGSHVVASLLPEPLSSKFRSIGFLGVFAVLLLMQYQPFREVYGSVRDALMYPFDWVINLFI